MKHNPILFSFFALCLAAEPSNAGEIAIWADWTAADATTASGIISGPESSVGIEYSGMTLLSQTQVDGDFSWNEGCCGGSLLGEDLIELPDGDAADPIDDDIIATLGGVGTVHTFSFSDIETIGGPIYINFFSIGTPSQALRLNFGNTDFEVLESNADREDFAEFEELEEGDDHILLAREGSGTIAIYDFGSDISFTTDDTEFFWGFTVGVDHLQSPDLQEIPTLGPFGSVLLFCALASAGWLALRRRPNLN